MDNTTHVKCMICGALKKELNGHIRMHGISSAEYKVLYPDMPMISPESSLAKSSAVAGKSRKKPELSSDDRDRRSRRMKERWATIKAEMGDEAYATMKRERAESMRAAKGSDYRHSDSTKEKMKGPRLHTRGRSISDEHRAKMSAAAKARPARGPKSEETKEKMREAWVRRKSD
jgi:hypothetical protein